MKKPVLMTLLFAAFVLFSCSKKDEDTPSPKSDTTLKIENNSLYDFKMFQLYAITGTTREDVLKDTTAGTRAVYKLGPLEKGKSITTKIDPKFKSLVLEFTYNNPVLGNKDYNAYIITLGEGSDAVPYVLKSMQSVTINLDEKMKFKLLP